MTERSAPFFREGVAHDEPVSLADQEAFGNHLGCYASKASPGVLSVCIARLTKRQCEGAIERL